MDAGRVRMYLRQYCRDIREVRNRMSVQVLVKGKDVVRYHRVKDSEDDMDSENENSGDKDANEYEDASERVKTLKPIAVGDEDLVPMYAKCENCKEEFDISANDTRECQWHTGKSYIPPCRVTCCFGTTGGKELYYNGDCWADHDENCHGDPSSIDEDHDFAEGFMWSCENFGDHKGCKTTKQKAPVDVIQVAGSNKRRAGGELQQPVFKR